VVIFNSFDWVPGNNEQAEDRAFRIGQKSNVNVYYQLFDDTISTRIWELLKEKTDNISIIMGDKKN
jgi:SNF2 family DNA or RNA helicase